MDNDFIVQLIARLDTSKTITDVAKIESELNKKGIELKPTVDTAVAKTEMKNLAEQLQKILSGMKIDVSTGDILSSMKQIQREQQKLNDLQKKSSLDTQAKYYNNIKRETTTLYSLKQKLLTADKEQTAEINRQIKATQQRISYNNKQLNKKGLTDDSLTHEINNLDVAKQKQLELNVAKQKDIELSKQVKLESNTKAKSDKIASKLDTGSYSAQLTQVQGQFEKWGMSASEAKTKVDSLRVSYNELANSKPGDERIKAEEKFQKELQKSQNEVKELKAIEASPIKVTKMSSDIQSYLKNNSAMSKEAKTSLLSYVDTLKSGNVSVSGLADIETGYKKIQTEERLADRLGKKFGDTVKAGAKKFIEWTLASGGVMVVVSGLKNMVTAVKDVNKATVELKKVTNLSDNGLANYYDDATESAKKYGASIADVISSTSDWSRLGYGLPDAKKLSDATTLLQKVGDNMTQETSSEGMISTLKGFQLEADEAKKIVDVANEVANTEPIDTAGIFEGLQRSASSLYTAGNTYQEAIALLTAGNSVTQDAEAMGTSLKTVSLRLTSTSAELEQMGEDTEYACETMSDYRDLVMGLTHNKVDILGDDGQYKNTYNILKDISGVFDEMSSMEQSSLLKSLFGVRQANSGAAILQNFDIAEKSLASATDSDGSAEKELENWNQGIEAHVARAKESFEELANDTINSSLIKGSVDIGSGLLKALDAIVDKFGALPPLIGLISAGLSGFKNIGIFTTIDTELTGITNRFGLFNKSLSNIKRDLSTGQGIVTSVFGENSVTNKDIQCIKDFDAARKQGVSTGKAWIQNMTGCSVAAKQQTVACLKAKGGLSELTASMKSTTIASKAASVGLKALSMAGNMIAGMAIAWAIGKAIEGIDNLIHATEKAKEKIADLSSKYDEGVSNLGSLNSELDTTKSKIDELESKGNLTFTEKDELENLKQQNAELQRSIDLQGQKNKTSATKTVGEVRDDIKKLNKGFTSDLTDYTDKEKEVKDDKLYYDTQKRNGASSNYLSNIEETMAQDSDDLASFKDAVIQNIQDYQSYKEAIVNAYGEDKTYWDKNTLDMYDGFNKQIDKAYKEIYSKSQYNKFVVEPVFDKEGLEGMQEDLLAYFSKNGSLDESELRKKFGTSIIGALKSACEDAGIDFAKMLSDMNDNAQQALNNFAPEPKNINSSYDAQRKANSDAKRELFNGLSDEDKTLVIDAKVPDEVKNGTEKDMQEWINKLKTDVENNHVELNFDSVWESLSTFTDSDGNVKDLQKDFIDLANAGELTADSFKGLDGASELLDKTKLSADELVDKINELSSSADQLSSMQSGISGLSSILETKKSNSSTPIGADVLSGLPDEVKQSTKEYEDFVEVLGDSNSSFDECQKATNDLASAYVNSNNFLANLTDTNKDYYIAQLSNMGVQNAEEVVMDSLAQKTKNLAAEKEFATAKGHDLANATYDEVSAFIQEQGYSDAIATALLQLALQKQLVNGTTLDFSGDLTNIQNYLEGLGKASSALATLQAQKNAQASGKAYYVPTSDQSKIKSNAQSDVDSALSKKVKTKLDIKPTSSNSSSGSGGSSGSSKEATKTKEIIDNIAPALEKLKTVASKAKDEIDDLLNFNAKKNQTKDAISATSKAIIAEQKAVEKYEKYAKKSAKEAINGKNGVSKSTLEKYEKLVRDGSLEKNAISTIKNEKLKTAISDYKSWYSSAKSCNEEIESLNDTLKDLYSTLANNPIEKAADSIDKLSKKMGLSNARLKNTNNIDDYKSISSDIVSNYQRQTLESKSAMDSANTNLSSANNNVASQSSKVSKAIDTKKERKNSGLNSKEIKTLNNCVKANKLIPESILKSISNNKLYKKCSAYNESIVAQEQFTIAADTATENYNLSVEQNAQAERQIQKDVFDRIKLEYERQLDALDYQERAISSKIDLIKAKGALVSANDYKSQIAYENQKISMYITEKAQLQAQLAYIQAGTDEWFDAEAEIRAVNQALEECDSTIVGINNSITELADSIHDKLLGDIQRISDEADFYASLVSNKDLTNKDSGSLTNEGMLTLGSYVGGYKTQKAKSSQTKKLLDDLQSKYNSGQLSFVDVEGNQREYGSLEQLKDKISELYSTWRDNILSVNAYEQKAIDLISEKYKAELEYMKKLIDAKKDALEAEKDLYNYQKSISDKTKNISTIQKQIVALSGDTSEESMAKTQQLQQKLEDAQSDLNDAQYDKMISEQSAMLDNLYEEYENLMNNLLQDTDKLIQDAIASVDNNTGAIEDMKQALCERYDYSQETAMNGLDVDSPIYKLLNSIYEEIGVSNKSNEETAKEEKRKRDEKEAQEKADADAKAWAAELAAFQEAEWEKAKQAEAEQRKAAEASAAKLAASQEAEQRKADLAAQELAKEKEEKKEKKKGKKKGISSVGLSGFANGGVARKEIQGKIEANGDSLLASVNPNETILTSKFTDMLPKTVDIMSSFNNIKIPDMPNLSRVERNQNTNIGDVNLIIDGSNITDKNSFISTLKDPTVQKAVRSVTTDLLSKGNRLGINKY